MKLTIIREMGLVHVDGSGYESLDVSAVPTNVHAFHWDSATSHGEVEYNDGTANEEVSALPSWASAAKSNHDSKKAVQDQEEAEAEAYANSDAGKADAIRAERDFKIAETDWWALSDNAMTQAQRDYREALRDITEQSTFPDSVVWPTKP